MAEPQLSIEAAKGLTAGIVEQNVPTGISVPPEVIPAIAAWKAGRAETALQMVAGEICPFTKEDVIGVVKENLSSQERDRRTGQKKEPRSGTPEESRYKATLDMAETLRAYLESGGQNIPDKLLPPIYDYLSRSPLFRDLIVDSNGALKLNEAQAIAKTLLQQPEVRKAILKLFSERLDPKKRLEHEVLVRELQTTLDVLKGQVILESESEIADKIQSKRKELLQKRASLSNTPNYSEYFYRKNIIPQIQNVIQKVNNGQISPGSPEWSSQVVSLLPTTSNIDMTNKNAVLAELDRLEKQYTFELETDSRFNDARNLDQEILALEHDITDLEQKKAKAASKENQNNLIQYRQTEQQLQEAQALLTAERIKYASEIMAIPAEAVKEFLDEALGNVAQHYKEEVKKAAEKSEGEKKRLEEQALEKLGGRLGRKEKIKRGETRYLPDKKQAREMLSLLFHPDGVRHFMGEIAKNERTLMSYGLSREEAQAILNKKNNPEFVKTAGEALAKKVLADYLLADGKLSRDDILALGNSEWVKSLIEEGLNIAQQQRGLVEGMVGKDVLTKLDEMKQGKSTGEWLRANWWKFGIGIIAILLLLGLGLKVKG